MSEVEVYRVVFVGHLSGTGQIIRIEMPPQGRSDAEAVAGELTTNAIKFMEGWFAFGSSIIKPREFAAFSIRPEKFGSREPHAATGDSYEQDYNAG